MPSSPQYSVNHGTHAPQNDAQAETTTRKRIAATTNISVLTMTGGGNTSEHRRPEAEEAPAEGVPISISQGIGGHRYRRQEMDGGMSLEGGRLGETLMDVFDRDSTVSEGSTLPPPYSSDFGEPWCVLCC